MISKTESLSCLTVSSMFFLFSRLAKPLLHQVDTLDFVSGWIIWALGDQGYCNSGTVRNWSFQNTSACFLGLKVRQFADVCLYAQQMKSLKTIQYIIHIMQKHLEICWSNHHSCGFERVSRAFPVVPLDTIELVVVLS